MTFYERLLNEKSELDEKRNKLHSFLESDKIKDIDGSQISLLNIQSHIMEAYSQVLCERISLLTSEFVVNS